MEQDVWIALGADHGGWELKEGLKAELVRGGYRLEDFSHSEFDPGDDYPDIAARVAQAVSSGGCLGVMICSTGTGSAIVANKFAGVRAAALHRLSHVILARRHNHLNLLCLGALEFEEGGLEESLEGGYRNLLELPHRPVEVKEAMVLVRAFLMTPCEGGRHLRRVEKIAQWERVGGGGGG
ncbi:MAG: hypothetical protein D6805_10465, partial [Planctomycetota bacterium]